MAALTVISYIATFVCFLVSLTLVLRRRLSHRKRLQPVAHDSRLLCEVCNTVFHNEELYRRHTESPLSTTKTGTRDLQTLSTQIHVEASEKETESSFCSAKRDAAESQALSSQSHVEASETETNACLPLVGTDLATDDDNAEGSEEISCFLTHELSTEASTTLHPKYYPGYLESHPEDLESPCELAIAQQASGVLASPVILKVEGVPPEDVAAASGQMEGHDQFRGQSSPIELPQPAEFREDPSCSPSPHEIFAMAAAAPLSGACTSASNLTGSTRQLSCESLTDEGGKEVDQTLIQGAPTKDAQLLEIQAEPPSSSPQQPMCAVVSAQLTTEASMNYAIEDFCEEHIPSVEQHSPAELLPSLNTCEPLLHVALQQGSSAAHPASLVPTCFDETAGEALAQRSDGVAQPAPVVPSSVTNSTGAPSEPSATDATTASVAGRAKKDKKGKQKKDQHRIIIAAGHCRSQRLQRLQSLLLLSVEKDCRCFLGDK